MKLKKEFSMEASVAKELTPEDAGFHFDSAKIYKGGRYFYVSPEDELVQVEIDKITKKFVVADYTNLATGIRYPAQKEPRYGKTKFVFHTPAHAREFREWLKKREKEQIKVWFVDRLYRTLELANETIKKHSEEVVTNPAYAMEWADKVFRAAATHKVYSILTDRLEKGQTPRQLCEFAKYNVLNLSQYIYNKSTSPCTNLMKDYELSIWADFESTNRYFVNEENE
jgi:hypothetical protein